MPIYRVNGELKSNGIPTTVFVRAQDEAEARNYVVRLGIHSREIDEVEAADIPVSAEILDVRSQVDAASVAGDARTQNLVRRLEHSNLINHPIKTIACGVLLGLIVFNLIMVLIALLFGGTFTGN